MSDKIHPTERVGRKPKSKQAFLAKSLRKLPAGIINWYKQRDKNTRLAMTLASVLFIVGVFSFSVFANSNDTTNYNESSEVVQTSDTDESTTAMLMLTEGSVEKKNEEGEWETVEEETVLAETDEVRTVGATSKAIIALQNGSEARLDANTEVILESISENRVVLKQLEGYMFNRVITNEEFDYIVKTTDSQFQATGTAFQTIANGDEQAVEVYENSVLETNTNQAPEEGNKLIVKSRPHPSDNGRITKLDIEVVKNDPFISWNRERDSASDEFKDKLGFLSDIEAPAITISSPADGETVLLESNANEGSTSFSGTTESSVTLTVQSKSTTSPEVIPVTVDGEGKFTTPVLTAPIGNSVFEFIAKDRTGNKTTLNIRINFQRKSQPVETETGIVLTVKVSDDKVSATWALTGSLKTPDGIKLVYGKDKNPTYDDESSVYVKSGTNTSIKLTELESETTYYFRACVYDKDKNSCSTYSNSASLKTPE
jgi:hypothetical protein